MTTKTTTRAISRTRLLLWSLLLPLGYPGIALLLEFFPGEAARPIASEVGHITIYLRAQGVHTDLILPLAMPFDWRTQFPIQAFPQTENETLRGDFAAANWVSIGWGDREFYLHTPNWRALRLGTALRALSGQNASVLHVEYLRSEWLHDQQNLPELQIRTLRLTSTQYQHLVEFILRSTAGRERTSDLSFGNSDAFFAARGNYSAIRTCNVWVGDALAAAGVSVSRWTPFPGNVLRSLPKQPEIPGQ